MALEIRLVGELVVARDGQPLALPASKKTRALLAYLAATGKPQLRERLCALLWDGPDDPRAALRWSLTKLRPLVDDARQTRLVADRERVELVPGDAAIDLAWLRAAAPGGVAGVARASTEVLEAVAPAIRGELLEGLDLPDCFRYDEWLRAEREAARRLGIAILSALVARDAPDALAHARSWLALDPLDEAAHGAVMRALVALDRKGEALAHYASASRWIERELGRGPSRELERLRIAIGGATTAAPAQPLSIEPVAPAALPLVGRAQELAVLRELVAGTCEQLVLLLGDPGIGKSRLLDEVVALAQARGFAVLRGRGVEAEQMRPYGAWLDAFAGANAHDHPFAAEGERDRARLFEAVAEWLAARAHGGGLVLVLDDLQWIDEATAALLHYVARSPRTAKLLHIACAARPGELADHPAALRLVRGLTREGAVRQIGLSPLDAAETRALAAAYAPDVDGARVFAESGGHPLFAVEIARALARGDTAWDSLDELLADRLELVDGSARELLPWAAALGSAFSADVLAAVTGLPLADLSRAIGELERRAIVRATGLEWDFVHDLVRAAAYRRVSEPRRRLLHVQIARALAALPDPDGERASEIAHHAGLGDDSPTCARACLAAATRALRLAATEEAIAISERGLGHAAKLVGRERVRLQIDLLAIAVHANRDKVRRAVLGQQLERAVVDAQVAGFHAEAAHGLNELSHVPYLAGDYAAAADLSFAAVRRARQADETARATTLAYSAQCLALIGHQMHEAEELAHEALELLGDHPFDEPTLPLAFALIREHEGDEAAALAMFERAGELAAKRGLWWPCALAWGMAARIELARQRPRAALAYCDLLRDHAAQIGDSADLPYGEVIAALANDADPEPALARLRAADSPRHAASALVLVAERELVRGDLAVARRYADAAVAEATRVDRGSWIVVARDVAARVAEADGRDADARAHTEAVRAVPPDTLSARALAIRDRNLDP